MRRINFFLIVTVFFLMGSFSKVQASTQWSVCENGCDFTSIQAGIDGANSGDTLLLKSVFYYENVVVHKNVNIHGRAPGQTIVSGSENGIVIMIEPSVRTIISNLDILDGSAENGSCVYNNGGTVILNKVNVSLCQVTAHEAGAVFNNEGRLTLIESTVAGIHGRAIHNYFGPLTLERSSILSNEGGIYNFEGAVTISYSNFSGNALEGISTGGAIHNSVNFNPRYLTISNSAFWNNQSTHGAAVYSTGRGPVKIANSTFSENRAIPSPEGFGGLGGGVSAAGSLTISNSTFVGNEAKVGAHIYFGQSKNFQLNNSIFANSGGSTICAIPYNLAVKGGHNLIDDDSCGFPASPVTNLAGLAYNGGLTPTYALLPGSNAIDNGDNTICSSKDVGSVDQRGFPRNDGACDIGAFELQE